MKCPVEPRANGEMKIMAQCEVCHETFSGPRTLQEHMELHIAETPTECPVCKKKFSSEANVKRHMMLHTGERPFKCTLCDAGFIENRNLRNHMMLHKRKPYYCSKGSKYEEGNTKRILTSKPVKQKVTRSNMTCSVCKRKFVQQGRYKRHMLLAHTGGNRKTSSQFTKTLMQKSSLARRKTELRSHMRTLRERKVFKCSQCDECFNLKSDLDKHVTSHFDDKAHSCTVCSKTFSLLDTLKKHIATHKVEKPYQCSVCNEGFVKLEYLKRHMSNHTTDMESESESATYLGAKLHKCTHCDKAFALKPHLDEHMLTHKDEDEEEPEEEETEEEETEEEDEEEKPHKCTVCKQRFGLKSSLLRHMNVHPEYRPHQCPRCKMGFSLKQSLDLHMTCHKGKGYKCSLCGEKYSRAESFNRHVMWHSGEWNYKCALCDAEFILNKELNAHMRKKHPGVDQYLRIGDPGAAEIRQSTQNSGTAHKRPGALGAHRMQRPKHTGDKPYKCSYCDKAFIYESVFNRHVASHKNEKHFKCPHCSKAFVYKSLFNQHLMTHREEQRYECYYCDTEFVHKSVFRRHMETHEEEESYRCKCGAEFMVLENLERHMVKHTQAYIDSFEPSMTPCSEDDSCTDTESHKCWHCEAGFPSQHDLFKHITAHICFICSDIFCQFEYLHEHIKTHEEGDCTKCLRCGENFTNKSDLLKHLKTHTLKEQGPAKQPGLVTKPKKYVLKIKKTQKGERSFKCSGCEKEFVDLLAAFSHLHNDDVTETCQSGVDSRILNDYEDLTIQRTAYKLDDAIDIKEDVISQIYPNYSDCLMCKNGFPTLAELEQHLVAHRYMLDIAQSRGYC